jgi:hypothetical protein
LSSMRTSMSSLFPLIRSAVQVQVIGSNLKATWFRNSRDARVLQWSTHTKD